jgi:hypothetical protein
MDNTNTNLELVAPANVERQQLDVQVATAKRWPRDIAQVKRDMLAYATLDEETASGCFYTLPRAGKSIQGPSVRLAEIAFSCMGNLRLRTRILSAETTGPNPHVVVCAEAVDVERNNAISIEKRRRITCKRNRPLIDEDDIQLATNAAMAVAKRDAILNIVPRALVNPICEAAKRVAVGDVKSHAAKLQQVVNRLHQMGVTDDRICAVVDCKAIGDIDADQLAVLIGLGTAIRDGETTLEDAFPPPPKNLPIFKHEVKPEAKPAEAPPATPAPTPKAEEPQPPLVTIPIAQAPAAPAAPAPPVEKVETVQDRLAEIVTNAGYSYAEWAAWVEASGMGPMLPEEPGDFSKVGNRLARRVMGLERIMLDALAAAKQS